MGNAVVILNVWSPTTCLESNGCVLIVNFGSGNGLMRSGNYFIIWSEPMLTKLCVTFWRHNTTFVKMCDVLWYRMIIIRSCIRITYLWIHIVWIRSYLNKCDYTVLEVSYIINQGVLDMPCVPVSSIMQVIISVMAMVSEVLWVNATIDIYHVPSNETFVS